MAAGVFGSARNYGWDGPVDCCFCNHVTHSFSCRILISDTRVQLMECSDASATSSVPLGQDCLSLLINWAAGKTQTSATLPQVLSNKTVSQACTVAKSGKFRWATGQSNLANRMEDCSIGQRAVVSTRKLKCVRFCCSQLFVCLVWLSNGLPELFTFSDCTWLTDTRCVHCLALHCVTH